MLAVSGLLLCEACVEASVGGQVTTTVGAGVALGAVHLTN